MTVAYPIPSAALDDRLGWVGTAGGGKTYNAGVGVERLFAAKARVIILDPLDVWWGLRLREDGKTPSVFAPVIFGGPHGDLPLNERSGALLGETCASMRESCIISLADFKSGASERRFMLDFLSALDRNANREPVHLVFDEADLWAPQLILDKDGDATKLLGQMQTIVRRGRVKGFIPWLITQRPAAISKGVLSQIDGMVAFKLTSSQDREAIGGWIKGQADAEVGKAILASLPAMQQGEGVVWVPGRGILATAQFPAKATFDSSRTPKRGEVKRTATLKPLHLGALKGRLAAVEEEAKANDPKALKAEIGRLKAEAAKAPPPAADPAAVESARQRGYHEGWIAGVEEGEKRGNPAGQALMLTRVRSALDGLKVDQVPEAKPPIRQAIRETSTAQSPVKQPVPPPRASIPEGVAPKAAPAGNGALTGPQSHLLGSLAWWAAMGHQEPTRTQLAAFAGWTPKGSNLRNRLSELSTLGFVAYPRQGHVRLTPEGAAAAPPPDLGQTLLESIRSILTGPQSAIFEALLAHGGEISRADLATAVGWEPAGSNLRNRLSELSTLELVEYPARGSVQLQSWVTQ